MKLTIVEKHLLSWTAMHIDFVMGKKDPLVSRLNCERVIIFKIVKGPFGLQVKGTPTKLTVHGINSEQLIDTETVELKLTPVHSDGSCSSFPVKPFVRNDLKIGNDYRR